MRDAFGRGGYVWEGLADALESISKVLVIVVGTIIAVIIVFFLLRWAYTDYYIATHCTTVLGTRVCQQ